MLIHESPGQLSLPHPLPFPYLAASQGAAQPASDREWRLRLDHPHQPIHSMLGHGLGCSRARKWPRPWAPFLGPTHTSRETGQGVARVLPIWGMKTKVYSQKKPGMEG